MRRTMLAALGLAALLAIGLPGLARAEIIDFNPAQDTVPEILTPEELARYNQLRQISRPSVASSASPDGRYVLVNAQGALQVLDTTTKALQPLNLPPAMVLASPLTWISPTQALAFTFMAERNAQGQIIRRYDYARTTLDAPAATLSQDIFEWPSVPGRNLVLVTGRPLMQTSDGQYHATGYTLPAGAELIEFSRPSFDRRSPEERAELDSVNGTNGTDAVSQASAQLVAIGLDEGSVTVIGDVPPGRNINLAAATLSIRPGADTFSYIAQQALPWANPSRPGTMATGFWNTQEALGLVPEEENLYLTRSSLHIVDPAAGTAATVENIDHAPGLFASAIWTADGQWLIAVKEMPSMLEGRENPVYEYTSAYALEAFAPTGAPAPRDIVEVPDLAAMDPPMDTLGTVFSPLDGARMLVRPPVNTTRHLYILDLTAGDQTPEPVYTGDQMLYSYALGGETFIGVLGDVADPGEVYVAQVDDVAGSLDKVTESNPQLDGVSNIAWRSISYQTSQGHSLKGIYAYPADWPFPPPRPMPLVVWQEGGPGGQMYNTWGSSVESPYSLLPNFGIPVLIVNGSGRLSNGGRFYSAMADGRNFGQRDIQDVKEAVDHLIELEIADPAAVGVTGCSYGGYFTLQSLVEYPDFYAAGNSQCSLNDLVWEYNFGWSPFLGYLLGRTTTGDPAEYLKDSPIYRSHQIRAPLLQFHGTGDFLPFEHITNIHDQVEANGTPSVFFRAQGYGHGIGSIPADRVGNGQKYAFQLQLSWFREHLPQGMSRSLSALRPILPQDPFRTEPWR